MRKRKRKNEDLAVEKISHCNSVGINALNVINKPKFY